MYEVLLLNVGAIYLLGVMSPGPNFVLVTSHAVRSRNAALLIVFGFFLGSLTWASFTLFGLALFLRKIHPFAVLLRVAGAGYLMFVGSRMLQSAASQTAEDIDARCNISGWRAVWRGYFTTIANPKTAAFFTSLFAAIVPIGAPIAFDAAMLTVIGGVCFTWYGCLAVLFSTRRMQSLYQRFSKAMRGLCGGLLFTLGVRLGIAQWLP